MFISQRITWSCLALTVIMVGVICQNEGINETDGNVTGRPSIATNGTTLKPFRKGGRALQDLHAEPTQAHANPILTLKPQFCEALQLQERLLRAKRTYRRECKTFNNNNLKFFLSLFVIISWGALVRCILRATHASLPYTVVLMITGLLVGLGSRIPKSTWPKGCEQWTIYTKIARMPPQIILYVFLPVLLFESAFSMSPHVFYRSCAQILVAALPGMLISTFVTALVCQYFLKNYNWDFNQASLFGSIISATDPVAVVAILKELGTSEALSTMIEGESLLNDGIAILMYEIFEGIVVSPKAEGLALRILQKFCQITLGGPAFGFFMAKIAILCVSVIFNDATVEITVTLVAAYLTYYIGEAILGVSGVMAVVVLGLVMSSEKTSISPEVESLVHHFWEMLGYLANTVLFVVVGIVISETAVNAFQWTDLAYLLFLYVALNIIRLLMLLVLSPVLSRLGYGLTWQSMIVMMWGGLRGAVGICLSLEIYTNPELCDNRNIGPKFLLQTAGIVFLTLVVNGTTTQALLDCLAVTELSVGRIQDMNNAHSQIVGAQSRTITALRNDRFLADAKWDLVEKYTSIDNPYANQRKNRVSESERSTSILSLDQVRIDHTTVCDECDHIVTNEPTKEEYRELTEEARLRCLKALKVSFWRQYEQGVLTDLAVQILRNAASAAEDKPLCIIHAKDLNKYWVLRGLFPWLQIQLTRRFGKDELLPPKPNNDCRRCCWHIATSVWFEYFIMIVVILNIIPAIWETHDIATVDKELSEGETWGFFGVNCVFLLIYVLEAIIKVLGRGARDYFCVDYWNYLDITLLIASFADITIALITNLRLISINNHSIRVLKFVRVSRVLRAVRLLRPVLPALMKIIDRRINEQLFLGYDVGKGFVTAVDDVIKFLPQMITHPKIQKKLRTALEHERLQTVREMGMLQKGHPGIAIAVKTRHASRAVLNQMRDALNELKEDGLIDEKENSILVTSLEEKMKRLWHSPPTIPSFPPETLLENLSWVFGNDQMLEYVKDNAELITYNFGDVISEAEEASNGIFVIVSGMVKIHYIPKANIVEAFEKFGIVPNMELFLDLTFRHEELDFFSTGTIIGEKNVLTDERRSATVTCETTVTAYHLPQEPMKQALTLFADPYDSLESRMWRSYGIRLATALLPTQPAYAAWTLDRIRMHLERSAVPIGDKFDVMTVPEYISDVIVIHGQVRNYHTQEVYQAPALVPRACSKFGPLEDSTVQARILVIAHEEIDREDEESGAHSNTSSLHDVLVNQSNIKIERSSRRFSRKSSCLSDNVSRSVKMEVVRRKSSLNRKTFWWTFFTMLVISPKQSVALTCPIEEKAMSERKEKPQSVLEKEEFCSRFKEEEEDSVSSFNHTSFHAGVCAEEPFDTDKLRILLVLALMTAYGCLVRTVLRALRLDIPYTVILFLSGMLVGYISKSFCSTFQTYTAIGRFAGEVYLFCFLPILIFESAFAIRPHVFMKAIIQILLVALVGMAIATFLTAIIVQVLLQGYDWTYLEASLFGSIISATDPVAVVSIMKELGASEVLSVLIEGESLLNDGVAVLLFEVLEEIVTCEVHENFGVFTLKKFCQVTLGGPAWGYAMGKATVLCISTIHGDAVVETSITVASAYLVYFIGEEVLGVSGIMALVALGLCVGLGKVYFSPKVGEFVHELWEVVGYIANTILFVIVGIIVTETAFNDVTAQDWIYLIILYVIVHVARVAMLLIMYPLVSRFGYNITWKDVIVMAWSGLRGAVGLCLALEIFENKKLCGTNLGPKFLFQMSGLVLMTMVINATTFKLLLKCLKMTEISSSKIHEVNEAVNLLSAVRNRVLNSLKSEPFAKGADWSLVSEATVVNNPYQENTIPARNVNSVADVTTNIAAVQTVSNGTVPAPDLHILREDARLAILRAFRASVHQQFDEGLMNEAAADFLLQTTSATENQELQLIRAEELKNYWRWQRQMFWSRFKRICLKFVASRHSSNPASSQGYRRVLLSTGTTMTFDCVIFIIAIAHLIPSIWDCVLLSRDDDRTYQFEFFICNVTFLIIYTAEALLKLIGQGCTHYFETQLLNYIDLAVIILLTLDVIFYSTNAAFNSIYVIIKIIPSATMLSSRVMLRWMDSHALSRLFIGYQIGRGFIVATDHVIHVLPRIIRHVKIMPKLIRTLESEKFKIIEELDLMYKYHPDIVRTAKTQEISNRILHQMLQSLDQSKDEGLLDVQECEMLTEAIGANRKQLGNLKPRPNSRSAFRNGYIKRRFHIVSNAVRAFRPS